MASYYYVINKVKKTVVTMRDTKADAQAHIDNSCYLFGFNASDFTIAKGAKERDDQLKQLKRG